MLLAALIVLIAYAVFIEPKDGSLFSNRNADGSAKP